MKKPRAKRMATLAIVSLAFLGLAACQPTMPPGGPVVMGGTTDNGSGTSPGSTTTSVPGDGSTTSTPGTTTSTDPTTTTTAPAATTTTSTTTPPTTTTTTTPPVTTGSDIPTPAGWTYVGGDEFNGANLDSSKWFAYHNNYGSGNNQLECQTPGNVSESGGALKIMAQRQTVSCPDGGTMNYTSGFLGSRETGTFYPRYGRFEMRAKLPHAQGMWPAFWLRHRNGAGTAEVDIMEYFHSQVPGMTSQTLHLDGHPNVDHKTTAFEAPTVSPGWHTWAVDILPDPNGVRFVFYTDGVAVNSYVDTVHLWTSEAPADGTWDIALNMAVGGNWAGNPDGTLGQLPSLGRCAISGTYPNCSSKGIHRVDWNDDATHAYQIDYVRVYAPAA